jgi:hypothetical protein
MNAQLETRAAALDEPEVRNGRQEDAPRHTALRAAYILSAAVAALMLGASAAGLLWQDLYPDGAWARGAFRGGDLVTLTLAAPLLILSLILTIRGSRQAQPVWIGMLGYAIYNYAYAVFGAEFNDVFLAHIAIFSMAIFALACALPNLEMRIAAQLRGSRMLRWIGGFLVLVGVAQGMLWLVLVLRFAFTGQLLNDIPVSGQHLVFALDLSLLVPTLVLAGLLLYQRTPVGLFMGTAVSIFGAVYQVNLMLAGVFQASLDVPGVKPFPLESIVLTVGFVAAAILLVKLHHPERS